MRTTLDIDNYLYREAKRLAAESGKSLTRVVEEALRAHLQWHRNDRTDKFRLELLTKKGRLIPGVNVDDRDSLYERMEGRG